MVFASSLREGVWFAKLPGQDAFSQNIRIATCQLPRLSYLCTSPLNCLCNEGISLLALLEGSETICWSTTTVTSTRSYSLPYPANLSLILSPIPREWVRSLPPLEY